MRLEQAFAAAGTMPRPCSAEAEASGVPLRSLVAGEITWPGILGMLAWAGASATDRFLDLGAGHGRAVAAFALGYGGEARGVEIRPALVSTACSCLNRLYSAPSAPPAGGIREPEPEPEPEPGPGPGPGPGPAAACAGPGRAGPGEGSGRGEVVLGDIFSPELQCDHHQLPSVAAARSLI